jgi:hypothetical protein
MSMRSAPALPVIVAFVFAAFFQVATPLLAKERKAPHRLPKAQSRYEREEAKERLEATRDGRKHLGLRHTRSLAGGLSDEEGPRALELEKAESRSDASGALYLPGAAIGRAEMARHLSGHDGHEQMDHRWRSLGPTTATYPVATSRTNAPYIASGRITALAIDPRCRKGRGDDDDRCRLFVGAAGGGVWRTSEPFSDAPRWQFVSGSFLTNNIGALTIDPRDPDTIYAGTGEANASGDSGAGLGLYKSTDGGEHWRRLPSDLFNDLSISSIALDPTDRRTFYVSSVYGLRGISATNGSYFPPGAGIPGLYKTSDGGATFTLLWDGSGPDCAPYGGGCITAFGVDRVLLDPADPATIYAAATDVGIFRSTPGENGGAFTQIFFPQNQANYGSDRTDFALARLPSGKLRIYAANGATGAYAGYPAPQTSYSQVWRIDDARRPAAQLIAEQAQVVPGGAPPAPGGWKRLTNPNLGDPGYATYDFCGGQCWYDIGIYSPPERPDTVFVLGLFKYSEVYALSNARGVLRSTTAGEPDPSGVTFTDLTFDALTPDPNSPDYLSQTTNIHPDQHTLVFAPGNPDVWFEGSDGGLVRSSGQYASIAATCPSRFYSPPKPAQLATCQRLLSAVPTKIQSLNTGLVTLQFQHLSINPQNPLGELQGGTQDNGTFQYEGSRDVWLQTIGGDGGLSGFDARTPSTRFHSFYGASLDVTYAGGDPTQWLFISDPLRKSNERVQFYMPAIADPRPERSGTLFAGLRWVWRTADNGGDPNFLAANCNEYGPFTGSGKCGDWVHLGKRPLSARGISFIARAPGDTGTLWAASVGRIHVFKNADAADPSAAGQFEISGTRTSPATTPARFVSGIVVDPLNANHAWVAYGGYDAIDPVGVPGHVYEVTWDGVSPQAVFTLLDGSGPFALGDLPVNALARDDLTGDLYAANDFGVLRLDAASGHWHPASSGLPLVEVSSLAIDALHRVLYAATHGRGAYRLRLGHPGDKDDDGED